MHEITTVTLENEMDLILAHKQSMKLAEVLGLGLAAQTTFATAVSEVCRNLIDSNGGAYVRLSVSEQREGTKYITAHLYQKLTSARNTDQSGLNYARRLIPNIKSSFNEERTLIELNYRLPALSHINSELIQRWRVHLNNDPSVSPYEEIKRQNRQLSQISEQLRESEERYRTLADSLPIMIFTVSLSGEIVYANEWMLTYTGKSLSELNREGWTDILHPDDADNPIRQQEEDWPVFSSEMRVKEAASGDYRWHTGASISMESADKSTGYRNAFFVDIHAQKMIEQALKDNVELKTIRNQLEEKVSELHRSNSQLEQFAYIASHDLQEPLRKISFYSDYLKNKVGPGLADEQGLKYLDNLVRATARMKALITDILLYSTVSKIDDSFTEVDLNVTLEQARLDLELAIADSGAQIISGELPVIRANEVQMKQLFENLISNAIKFARPGIPPEILIEAGSSGGNIAISFKDNGIGFDMAFSDKMFVLFQRLHARDKYEGTGIGLALCKKIMDHHNGHITAYSQAGAGATFTVMFPLPENNSL